MADLKDEAVRMTDLLRGKAVKVVTRNRSKELMIEFDDGTRLFVDRIDEGLAISIN